MQITFKEFKSYIDELLEVWELENKIFNLSSKFCKKSKSEFSLNFPTLADPVIKLLETVTCDKDQWISYWVFDLDCGKKYEPGCIKDVDGSDIPLKTIEDLWKLLTENYPEGKISEEVKERAISKELLANRLNDSPEYDKQYCDFIEQICKDYYVIPKE